MLKSCVQDTGTWQTWAEIATTISAPIAAISLAAAVVALWFTRNQHLEEARNFRETLQVSCYTDLDRMYFDLIAMRVGKPHLSGNPRHIETVMQRQEYREYGFLVWNFLETLFDRCLNPKLDQARYESLKETWKPAFESEMTEHQDWWRGAEQNRFKRSFRLHVKKELRRLARKELARDRGKAETPPAPHPIAPA